ncbi:MAG: glycosyltransferase family 39 protein [Acidobacteriota bacterium]|nr:glycosyltransferase family 39 protein [Acidobacteriota bacterium]
MNGALQRIEEATALWQHGAAAPVFASPLPPFHPLSILAAVLHVPLPPALLIAIGAITVLVAARRLVTQVSTRNWIVLTIVATLAILGCSPIAAPFVIALPLALASREERTTMAVASSLLIAALLSLFWWWPALEARHSPARTHTSRGSWHFVAAAQTGGNVDHIPGKTSAQANGFFDAALRGERIAMHGGRIDVVAHRRIRVTSDGWNLVATPMPWWPGWRVYQSTRDRLPPVRVEREFVGVFVPPGSSEIEFRYRPETFDRSLRISAFGLLLFAVTAIWPWYLRIGDAARAITRIPHLDRIATFAALIAYAIVLFTHRSTTAGGADSSGYLNEARLFRRGAVVVPLDMPRALALPSSFDLAFIPLGFVHGTAPGTMVPSYPPGLPLHMALFSIFGERAAYLLGPLSALACAWLLYLLARELAVARGWAVIAAMSLAFSAVLIFMAVQPMSDVLATAWAIATILFALRGRTHVAYALAAGAAFGMGVLVRPTHILLAPAVLVLLAPQWRALIAFAIGGAPFAAFQALFAQKLYGSPFASGYGRITDALSLANVPVRFTHYSLALMLFLTPLLFPLALFTSRVRWTALRNRIALVLWFAAFFAFYCAYESYETWWYTRFLLPAIPALVLLACGAAQRWKRSALIACAVLLFELGAAWQLKVLTIADGERVYELAARAAGQQTNPRDLIVAMQHSGALYFYTHRLALRWDQLTPEQFAIVRARAAEQQRNIYALVWPFELAELRRRTPGAWREVAHIREVTLMRLE